MLKNVNRDISRSQYFEDLCSHGNEFNFKRMTVIKIATSEHFLYQMYLLWCAASLTEDYLWRWNE